MSVRLVASSDVLYALDDDGTVWRHSFQTSTGAVYDRWQVGYGGMKWQWVRLSGPQPSVAKYLADSSQGGDALAAYKATLHTISPEEFKKMYQGTWPAAEDCHICAAQGIHGESVAPGLGVCYDHAVPCPICGQPRDPERPHTCEPNQEGPYEQTR